MKKNNLSKGVKVLNLKTFDRTGEVETEIEDIKKINMTILPNGSVFSLKINQNSGEETEHFLSDSERYIVIE